MVPLRKKERERVEDLGDMGTIKVWTGNTGIGGGAG